MGACRLITSPISGKEVQSKTWNDIYSLVKDEQKADELYDQLTSLEFISWFGDWVNDPENASKVVTEHGEPLIVYHGTGKEFDTFSKEKLGTNTNHPSNKLGFYTTSDKDTASLFAPMVQGEKWYQFVPSPDAKIMPLFINLRNPKIMDNADFIEKSRDITKVDTSGDGLILKGDVAFGERMGGDEYQHDTFVAFEPNQIKSVFNTGTYSSENDNIYHRNIEETVSVEDHFGALQELTDKQRQELKNLDGKSSKEVLDYVYKNASGKLKEVAKVLSENSDKLPFVKHFVHSYSAPGKGGKYNTEYGRMEVSLQAADYRFIVQENSGFNNVLRIFVHEYIHAYTLNALKQPKTEDEKNFAKYIRGVFNELSRNAEFKEEYGFSSPEEFVSELMMNPDFQAYAISAKKGLLQRIAEWFIKLFGGNVKSIASIEQNRKQLLKEAFEEILNFIPKSAPRKFTSGSYFRAVSPISEEQKQKQQSIANSLQEKRDKYGVKKEITKGALDEDEVNKYVRTLNGKTGEPKKRVTDFVRDSKTPAQIAKFENAPDVKKKEWKQKAALGTAFHAQAESIIQHATDSEGYLKPLNEINRTEFEPVDGFPPVLANALYDYLVGDDTLPGVLFTSFPQGTLFKVEEIVYDERASRDVAGTIDLIGIDPEGNIHIWDWKTKFLDLEKYDDVPFYSQKDYRIQLDQYKNILFTYGIKREQVKVAQAQPIVFDGIVDNKGNVTLTGAQFPVTDVKQEGRKYLVPVPVEDQSSGNKDLDDFIHQLYRLYETIYKQPSDNWVGKREQLNQIAATIRELQIKQNFEPLTGEALTFLGTVDKTIQNASGLIDGKNSGFSNIDGGEEAFKKALNSLLMAMKNIDKYVNVHALFNQIYKDDKLTDEQLVTEAKLSDVSAKALQHKVALKQAFEGMMDWFAKTKGVENILQAEKEISGWIDSDVQSTSRLQTNALNLFYKLESAAKSRRDVAIDTTLKSFKEKLTALKEYAKGKGVAAADIFTLLTGDKNRWKMVDKIKGQVYDELEEATDKNIDFLWINKNIDVQSFKEEMEQRLQDKLKQIDEETPEHADEELLAQMKSRKDYYKKHWDTSTYKSLGWFDRDTLKKYIKEDLWYTDEYRKIMNEKPVFEMYQWIEEFNRAAFKAGYFDGEWSASLRSLPWVRGSFMDKIGKGGVKAFSDTLKDIYTIHQEEEHQYRQSKDSKQKNIPRPFTHNLGKQEDGSYDLSEVSTDIGQTMTLFIQSVLDYQHTKEIESYVEALLLLEENKGHLRGQKGTDKLAIDQYGNFITDEGNEQNTKILEEQVNALVYKQYYDEKTGLPAEATKLIETGNDYLRLKVFSLNILTPVINTLGSSMQGMINSGKLFKGREWATNFMRFMTNKLSGNEGAVRKGLLDYFGLLHSNEKGQQVKQMSVEQLHRHSIKDILLGFMRLSDAVVQGTTGLSLLENSMITPDGRIVNIREYVRHSPEFRRIYDKSVSYTERKAIEKSFEKKVQELKETQSLIKKAKFNDKGILEVEGLSRDNDAYHAFRNVVRNEIGKITGMMSEAEKRNMERNILWKSMLMFKGWVPRLVEVRAGQIKHNHATDQYEMGRTRIWASILFQGTQQGKREGNILKGLLQGIKDLGDMRKANDRGLELLSQYYQKVAANYKARTGKELKMTPEEFYQMTREAIVMQYKDIAILLSLLSVFFYVKGTPPPDDPDDKNMRHMIVKALDKLKDEVSFYYNPLSAKQIFGGTLIPSLGVISDVFKTVGSTYTEVFGDESKQEKNHWIKGMMQNFPVSQQAASFFFPLADQELAKDLGIRVNEESRLNY